MASGPGKGYRTGITLQSFIEDRMVPDAKVYTDEHAAY